MKVEKSKQYIRKVYRFAKKISQKIHTKYYFKYVLHIFTHFQGQDYSK